MEGRAVEQLKRAAELPGMIAAAGMPDLHPGLSAPVGAALLSEGVIYPELAGGDVGCGIALFRTGLAAGKFKAAKLERRLLAHLPETPEYEFPAQWPAWLRRDLGTAGRGNHFVELTGFEEVRDPVRAETLGIDRRNLWLLVHSGSRGHGQALLERTPKGGLVPESEPGRKYLAAHDRLLEWAKLNRRLIAAGFLAAGAPFVIAGSRGTFSYLVEPAGEQSRNLWSAAHGAGRKWNRQGTRSRLETRFKPENLKRTRLGSVVVCSDRQLLYEEAPEAYKNIETVVDDLAAAGVIRVIGVLRPVLTWKSPKEGE
ncbi:RNA ligase RtcB family protein [Victivallis vadensis]|uniref:3'-phosphate/5'-hydroxy nucleic acid ligase n=2 Tax=Victivallis vadensis TaxID=172901 RepID=A0A848AX62_9BACT|nr:RNA ligase RtcB family protein [Victivallis vadensis]